MRRFGIPLTLAATLLAAGTAEAADSFTWRPADLGLHGGAFTADTFVLGDYAVIRFSFDGPNVTFLDRGILPVLGFTAAGQAVQPAGLNAANGRGWGIYIEYNAAGIQNFGPDGTPVSATFTALDYKIVGYNGLATVRLDPTRGLLVTGNLSGVTILGSGTLLRGGLTFVPDPANAGLAIAGGAVVTIEDVPARLSTDVYEVFDVQFDHPADEYVFDTGQNRILIPGGGNRSTATLTTIAAITVPEPGAAGLLGAGLLGLACLRRKRAG